MASTAIAAHSTGTSTWVRVGVIGGVLAGIVFAMFEMIMAAVLNGGGAFFMPLRMIGAIGVGASALDPATSLVTAGGAGLVIHMILSMMYGVMVAGVIALVGSLQVDRLGPRRLEHRWLRPLDHELLRAGPDLRLELVPRHAERRRPVRGPHVHVRHRARPHPRPLRVPRQPLTPYSSASPSTTPIHDRSPSTSRRRYGSGDPVAGLRTGEGGSMLR